MQRQGHLQGVRATRQQLYVDERADNINMTDRCARMSTQESAATGCQLDRLLVADDGIFRSTMDATWTTESATDEP